MALLHLNNGNKIILKEGGTPPNKLYALRALTGAPGFTTARSVGRYAPSFPRLRSPTLWVALLATHNVAYNKTLGDSLEIFLFSFT